ncbi:MAG: DUF427 domain-containing protein [Prochlorococcus sp.]
MAVATGETMEAEIVANYPRPPAIKPCSDHVTVEVFGTRICDTNVSLRVLETFHPPSYYIPPQAMRLDLLVQEQGRSYCEWKGVASYWNLVIGGQQLKRAVWSYQNPTAAFNELAGWYALYPGLMDRCYVNGELVMPQPGRFYGGWVTSQVMGPFKGDPNYPELI